MLHVVVSGPYSRAGWRGPNTPGVARIGCERLQAAVRDLVPLC